MTKVSIVIPVYNVEKFLRKSLDSAINQTLKEVEIIAVNDGSTDSSLEILREYENKYSNLKVISQNNKGLSGARNTGLKECIGEYVYFLDSDDYISLDSMKICYIEAKKHDLDIITFDAETFIDGNFKNVSTDKEEFYREDILESRVMNGKEFYVYANEKGGYRAPVWLNFYKREFIEKNKLYFYEGIIHEDEIHTSTSFIKASKVKYISNKFFFRRVRENSIMTRKIDETRIDGNYVVAKESYKLLKSDLINSKIKSYLIMWIRKYYSNCLMFCDSLCLKEKREEIIKNIEVDIIDDSLKLQIESPKLFYVKSNVKRNLFLVKTGYHLLLATSVAIEKYIGYRNDLVIFDKENIKFDSNQIAKVFDNIYDLNSLPRNLYDNIFSNNESDELTQIICNKLFKDEESFIYIEDGSAAYCNSIITYSDEFKKIKHIECIEILGTYSKIKERIFLYPDLIRDELKDGKPGFEINIEYLKKAIDIVYFDCEIKVKGKIIFIALEHKSSFNVYNLDLNKYKQLIIYLIENFKEYNILLKYHPRDNSGYMDKTLKKYKNINWVDKNINIEVFYKYEDIIVISSVSTSILSMNKLGTNTCVISKLLSNQYHRLFDVFLKLDIYMPNNLDQLCNYIRKNN